MGKEFHHDEARWELIRRLCSYAIGAEDRLRCLVKLHCGVGTGAVVVRVLCCSNTRESRSEAPCPPDQMIDESRHVVVRARRGSEELVRSNGGDDRLRLVENGFCEVKIRATHATIIHHWTAQGGGEQGLLHRVA